MTTDHAPEEQPKRKRRRRTPGRPPTFSNGHSTHRVRLKLTRAEWAAIDQNAEASGKSFREFLKQRLRNACPELTEPASKPDPRYKEAEDDRP